MMAENRRVSKQIMCSRTSLSVASWNINGIKNKDYDKGQDPEFHNEVNKHDIVCISETHTGKDYNIKIPGFCHKSTKVRPICKKNNKYYGGMILLVREELSEGVTVLKNKFNDSILVKLDKTHFSLDKDLFIGFFYVVPSNSTYTTSVSNDIDAFDEIESFIHKFSEDGDIILMGDFNSRVCTKADFIPDDSAPLRNDDFYEIDQIQSGRCSQDKNNNSQGTKLLDLCIGNKMRILNGRILGDLEGKYTCHRPSGSSVVDYGIVSEESLKSINTFKVQDYMGNLSDHCLIAATIRQYPHATHFEKLLTNGNNTQNRGAPPSYKWSPESVADYGDAISSGNIKRNIDNFMGNLETHTVDESVSSIADILLQAANSSLRKKRSKKSNRRKCYRKWFDVDCEQVRKNIKYLGKKLHKNPCNNHLREAFFREKKRYKKLIKVKRKEFRQGCIKKLEQMIATNPKEYWDTLRNLKKECCENRDQAEYITINKWKEHFQQLHEKSPEIDNQINNDIQSEEKTPYFSMLDLRITESEVYRAIKNLKNKKAAGYDQILGEMLKAGKETLIKPLTALFNKIFASKQYPQEWNKGIITPIHKKGSKLDPNNYRGITVNSVLAKTYSTILCNRLECYLEENKTIHDTQIITDHIFVLQALKEKYAKSKKMYMCFIDFEKAYDSVWREALLYKLLKNGIRGLFYHQIKSMLSRMEKCLTSLPLPKESNRVRS
jgi:exonuclease III